MFPARLELATFRVLGGRDNHYTTETKVKNVEHYTIIEMESIKLSIPTQQKGPQSMVTDIVIITSLYLSSWKVNRTFLYCTQPVANIPYNLL